MYALKKHSYSDLFNQRGKGKKISNFDLLKFSIQVFEPEWLYTGDNFGKVLNTLLAVNFATQGKNLPSFWSWMLEIVNVSSSLTAEKGH